VLAAGVGSALDGAEALTRALEEAYLLAWEQGFRAQLQDARAALRDRERDAAAIAHLEDYRGGLRWDALPREPAEDPLRRVVAHLPAWLTELYLVALRHSQLARIRVCLAFSPQLYNHLPLRARLDPSRAINQRWLGLSREDLQATPECIVG